jgi:hypothetical protein
LPPFRPSRPKCADQRASSDVYILRTGWYIDFYTSVGLLVRELIAQRLPLSSSVDPARPSPRRYGRAGFAIQRNYRCKLIQVRIWIPAGHAPKTGDYRAQKSMKAEWPMVAHTYQSLQVGHSQASVYHADRRKNDSHWAGELFSNFEDHKVNRLHKDLSRPW